MTHGDDLVLTAPTDWLTEFTKKGVYPIKTKFISYGKTESIKAFNRSVRWRNRGIVYQHDPRHVDVLVKDLGHEQGNAVQTPATHWRDRRRAGAVGSRSTQQLQVASCKMFVPQSISSRYNIHRERVASENVNADTTGPCQVEEAGQIFETRETM